MVELVYLGGREYSSPIIAGRIAVPVATECLFMLAAQNLSSYPHLLLPLRLEYRGHAVRINSEIEIPEFFLRQAGLCDIARILDLELGLEIWNPDNYRSFLDHADEILGPVDRAWFEWNVAKGLRQQTEQTQNRTV